MPGLMIDRFLSLFFKRLRLGWVSGGEAVLKPRNEAARTGQSGRLEAGQSQGKDEASPIEEANVSLEQFQTEGGSGMASNAVPPPVDPKHKLTKGDLK